MGEAPAAGPDGIDAAHLRCLEHLYQSAAVNHLFPSTLHIEAPGQSEIRCTVTRDMYHAAGAAHGALYFKMLDDAAFYAANSMLADYFVLTTQFNLFLTRPLVAGPLRAEGRWVSGHRRVLIAESRLIAENGEEAARGQGTFMRSHIRLSDLSGYG